MPLSEWNCSIEPTSQSSSDPGWPSNWSRSHRNRLAKASILQVVRVPATEILVDSVILRQDLFMTGATVVAELKLALGAYAHPLLGKKKKKKKTSLTS